MEAFIEHILNSAYHYQRQKLIKLYNQEPKTYASSHIRFGGWEISYNGNYIDKLTGHLEVKVNYDRPKIPARAS